MIELYAVNIKNPITCEQYEYFLSCVSHKKRERVKKYIFNEDAKRTLYGDVLLRSIANQNIGIANKDIIYKYNNYGKPYIYKYPNFHFNITHSGDWVVCAISRSMIGVDIEQIKKIDLDLAKRFFSTSEYEWLIKKPINEQTNHFFDLWTLKESYVKCLGKGLSIPLNSFSFYMNNDSSIYSSDISQKLSFKQYYIHKDYKLSVSAKEKTFSNNVNVIDIKSIQLNER